MCLSVPWPICTRLQVMSPKILAEEDCAGKTVILPFTERSFDLRLCGEHRDTSSGLGLGR